MVDKLLTITVIVGFIVLVIIAIPAAMAGFWIPLIMAVGLLYLPFFTPTPPRHRGKRRLK
jgi:hypothetical protein